MIDVEEEIIYVLEEIDNTFSSINRTLRDIKTSIEKMGESNQSMIQDLDPWIKFFDADIEVTEMVASTCEDICYKSDEDANSQEMSGMQESPLVMKFSSPRNPFVDNTSSEILNRTFLGDLDRRFQSNNFADSTSSSFIPAIHNKDLESYEESDSSDVLPLDPTVIPPAFRDEEDLLLVYDFISKNPGADIEQIYREFSALPHGKVDIFVDLLLRKRFISRKKGGFRTIYTSVGKI